MTSFVYLQYEKRYLTGEHFFFSNKLFCLSLDKHGMDCSCYVMILMILDSLIKVFKIKNIFFFLQKMT